MIKKNKWQVILSNLVILLPVLIGLLLWNELPDHMVTHWGAEGTPDRMGGKAFSVIVLPCIFLAAQWFCIFVTALDTKNKNQNAKVFLMVIWIIPIVSLIVCSTVYAVALGRTIDLGIILHVLMGLLFVVLGNYLPKCKQNRTIGIKIRWTLKNEENWNRTHRFTGKLWVFGGLILLATILVPMQYFVWVFLPFILVMAFTPMLYSYLYYTKQLNAGAITKEEIEPTPAEKKSTVISLGVGLVIILLALTFLFTGKFQITLGEDSFTIDAAYWDDAMVRYDEIDSVEFREQDDPHASSGRTYGYGSFSVLMGEFQNAEFGAYTRYSYTDCESCIVLTSEGNVLVINEKTEEETKALYDALCENIAIQ